MFPNPMTKVKNFFNNEDGMLPIEHGIAAAAIAAVIVASVASYGMDMSHVYSGTVLGGGAASSAAHEVIAGPGAIGDGLSN